MLYMYFKKKSHCKETKLVKNYTALFYPYPMNVKHSTQNFAKSCENNPQGYYSGGTRTHNLHHSRADVSPPR